MKKTFLDLVEEPFASTLDANGIKIPTEVQEEAIPVILAHEDVIVRSKTGTGKTLTYLLPILKKVDMSIKAPQAVILTPTHELAIQVNKQVELFYGDNMPTSAVLIGGVNVKRQLEKLKEKPRIIVGSAGRILQLLKMKKLSVHNVKTVVIDEADRLLDEKNLQEVLAVIKYTLKDRQLLFFSASMSDNSIATAESISKAVKYVNVSGKMSLPTNIEHMYFQCEKRDKIEILRKLISSEKIEKGIIFMNNEFDLDKFVDKLNYHGIKCSSISGNLRKIDRQNSLANFRNGNTKLLLASDLASRGLDIKGVTHIINLDLPDDPTIYLHRVGRTGRMDEKGISICICEPKEVRNVKVYEKKHKIIISEKVMSYGKILDKK